MGARELSAFGAFCLLSASDWVLPATLPSALPESLRTAAIDAVCAVLFAGASSFSSRSFAREPAAGCRVAGYGAALFAVPPVISLLAAGRVRDSTGVLLFTLVPVVVLLIQAQRRSGLGVTAVLPGALAGVGGAALLLPFALPPSTEGKVLLAVLACAGIAAAYASVQLPVLLREAPILHAATLLCAAAALLNALVASLRWTPLPELAWLPETERLLASAALTAAQVLLLLVCLRAVRPIPFAARYLLVPLLALGEGLLLAHGTLSPIVGTGFALLLGGAVTLLRGAGAESDAPDSILL